MARNSKFVFLTLFCVAPSLASCGSRDTLLFLNWGEYINDEVVQAFENKYNVNVVIDIADSNELFYAKLKSGTTKYDLCCPTDYMIEKMYLKNLIQKIDLSKLTNYKDGIFMDEVNQICNEMNSVVDGISDYHVPYFWGTFGLMYNKNNSYFSDENHDGNPDIFEKYDAWDVYFSDEKVAAEDRLPDSLRVGMYNAVRFSYAASMIYGCGNPNAELNETNKEMFKEILSRKKYTLWGGDTLKHSIVADNLDLAFNYTGDCLDMTYLKIQEGENFEDLSFHTYTPELTIAHIDSLVIPTGARNYDLALKFIDFLLDPSNEYLNACNVGYCPPLQKTYDMIVDKECPFDDEMFDEHWIENWAKAMSTTYPLDENKKSKNKGIPLTYFDNNDLKTLSNIVNNIKSGN